MLFLVTRSCSWRRTSSNTQRQNHYLSHQKQERRWTVTFISWKRESVQTLPSPPQPTPSSPKPVSPQSRSTSVLITPATCAIYSRTSNVITLFCPLTTVKKVRARELLRTPCTRERATTFQYSQLG